MAKVNKFNLINSIILNNKLFTVTLLSIVMTIMLFVYFPFINNAGFGPSDDLTFVSSVLSDKTFNFNIYNSLSAMSGRFQPISDLVLNIIFSLYKDNPQLYVITHLIVWVLIVIFISLYIKYFFDSSVGWIFSIHCLFPIFTSASTFSSYMVANYDLPVLFWAISIYLLTKYLFNNKFIYYLFSYFFVFIGLFSSPIILPLLLLNSLTPFILYKKPVNNVSIYYCQLIAKYILPIFFISIIYLFMKISSINYGENQYIYGVSGMNLRGILQSLYYFYSILFEPPLLLLMSMNKIFIWQIIPIGILVIVFYYIIFCYKISNSSVIKFNKYFLFIILISLVGCLIIFIISGYPAVTFGHYNKMMLPSYLLYCIILSYLFNKYLINRYIIFPVIISLLWITSFVVQLENFTDSWQIRKKIFTDCIIKLEKINLGNDPQLIANVPFFSQRNFNNEHVFWLSWDFFSGVKLFGSEKLLSAFPFCWQTLVNPDYYPNHNINHHLTELSVNANLWYYEYNIANNNSTLIKLDDRTHLEEQFQRIIKNRINYHPIILRQKIRMKLKDWVIKRVSL